MRIRRAFFAEGRNIGRSEVMLELAQEAELDMDQFRYWFERDETRAAVLTEGQLGKEQFGVRGTPTLMLESGRKLRHPMAYADIRDGRIVSVGRLPCRAEECTQAIRDLFKRAAESA